MKTIIRSLFLFALILAMFCLQLGVAAEDRVFLAYSVPTINSEFFVTMGEGAQRAADEFGAKLVYVGANLDVATQIKQTEDFIQQGVDVMLLQGADSAGIVAAINLCEQAGIPVVASGDRPAGGNITCYVGFDNEETGMIAAEYIAKQLNYEGNAVEIFGRLGTESGMQKSAGFQKALKKYPNIKLVASQPANFERATAMSVMENILQSQSKIDAVYAANDDMALGVIQAMKAANRLEGTIIVGTDGIDDAREAIRRGEMRATIATPPYRQGYIAVQVAVAIARGEKVPGFVKEANLLVTEENLDEWDVIMKGVAPEHRYWDEQLREN